MDDKVSAEDTNDGLCLFEFTGRGGGPSHLHHDQDEWFTDIDGEVEVPVGETRFRLGAVSPISSRGTLPMWGDA